MMAKSAYTIGLAQMRRVRSSVVAAIALLILLGALTTGIVVTQQQTKSRLLASFGLRGTTSARFVSTYISEQASREQSAARQFLATPRPSIANFKLVAATLGSSTAVLLDNAGRVLDTVPAQPLLRRAAIASDYPHLTAAEQGSVAVSGIISSPVDGQPVTAIAVPYPSHSGRRVLSADYPASSLALNALVDHTISYPQHEVLLVDSSDRLIAASPRSLGTMLGEVDPALARAAKHSSRGPIPGAHKAMTFTSAKVPGTSWRLLIAVPNSRLYASISGWTRYIPWLVLVLVSVLGALLVALFARSLADRSRLTALSAAMERTAQTDSLTGLYNRRALSEQLMRASARARRHDEPLSVLMIDLDRFKQTNDTFGHEAGDQVLCTIADCLRDVLRADDIYGRWGGDEFLVALPKTGSHGAEVTAERLRTTAAKIKLADIGLPDGVQMSVGVACGVHASQHDLVREADLALYRAKAMIAPPATGELASR
jgi:diguanylate cyclase (GGDEF)-like protein